MIQAIFKLVDKQDLTYDRAYSVIERGHVRQHFHQRRPPRSWKEGTAEHPSDHRRDQLVRRRRRAAATTCRIRRARFGVWHREDKAGNFNISTTAALVIASAGVKVAKHGNRAAATSRARLMFSESFWGSTSTGPHLWKLIDEVGLCFFFAQKYTPP